MNRLPRLLGFMLSVAAAALPSLARASRSNLPVGYEEGFMGNTGVALLGSPGAVYYNPAGLGFLESSSRSASGTSYYVISASGSAGSDMRVWSFKSVPHSLISTWKLGSGSLAFSILVPEAATLDVEGRTSVQIDPAQDPVHVAFAGSITTSHTLAGASWGGQAAYGCGPDCGVDLGISLFLSYAQLKFASTSFQESVTATTGLATSVNGRSSLISLMPIVGASLRVSKALSVGLRLQPPSFLISKDQSGKSSELVAFDSNKDGALEIYSGSQDFPLQPPDLPQLSAALGLKYEPSERE